MPSNDAMLCRFRLRPRKTPALGLPLIPMPGRALLSVGVMGFKPLCLAASNSAFARGCSLPSCKPAALARMSSTAYESPKGIISSSLGLPIVRVPVLSKATMFKRCANSNTCGSLMRIPKRAATPVPAMMAAGVARPRAHGHAITRTETARNMATDAESK